MSLLALHFSEWFLTPIIMEARKALLIGQSSDGSFLAWHSDTPCPQEATVFGHLAQIS